MISFGENYTCPVVLCTMILLLQLTVEDLGLVYGNSLQIQSGILDFRPTLKLYVSQVSDKGDAVGHLLCVPTPGCFCVPTGCVKDAKREGLDSPLPLALSLLVQCCLNMFTHTFNKLFPIPVTFQKLWDRLWSLGPEGSSIRDAGEQRLPRSHRRCKFIKESIKCTVRGYFNSTKCPAVRNFESDRELVFAGFSLGCR